MVGAGTLRATRRHQWTPQALARERAADLAALRAASGRPAEPAPLLVVSGSGDIPADADAVARPAVPMHVLTAEWGTRSQAAQGTPSTAPLPAAAIVEAARRLSGGGPVLCEGGPHLLGALLEGGVALDLFLTVAPQLAGPPRHHHSAATWSRASRWRPSQAHAAALVRRADNHLLLRYTIGADDLARAGRRPTRRRDHRQR